LGVGETTLVFFDVRGVPVNQHRGTTTETHLRRIIATTFGYEPGRDLARDSADLNAMREIVDRYNKGAKGVIDSMGR
jgi:hypothetical protein